MKSKETLEEAIKYYAHNNFDMHETNNYKALEKGFEAGAEWQQERSYSEEDMKKAQQAILGNIKDAMHDENYIIDYLKNK